MIYIGGHGMTSILNSKLFYIINMLLIVMITILSYLNNSSFVMACSICLAVFLALQLKVKFIINEDENIQKIQCRSIGFLLLIPSLSLVASGVLYFFDFLSMSSSKNYVIIALSGILCVLLLGQIFGGWKNKTVAGKFYKFAVATSLSVPMSIIVTILLRNTSAEGNILGMLSTVVFGALSILCSINMILVSLCDYRSIKDSIKLVHLIIKDKKLAFTRVSILKDVFLVVGKMVLSIISLSFFMFVNALYSAGMGIARYIAIKMHTQEKEKQILSYRFVGIIISAASICYVLYSTRLFFGGKSGVYNMNVALVIALYTFIEFGINIREVLRIYKSKALEAKALRAIGLSSTLLCFVLTQTAIMSFSSEGDNSYTNALAGVIFGVLAALVGLYVVVDSFRYKDISIYEQ